MFKRRLLLSILLVTLFAVAGPLPLAYGQTINDNLWVANGNVRSTVVAGNTLYVGGDFTYVGPATGRGAAIDVATGAVDLGLPKVNGPVNAVVPDGSGGWYVAGQFTLVGGVPRTNLVHVQGDKAVDGTWNPGSNGSVLSLALSGATLYVGGSFTSIDGQPRSRIAALDATTGRATAWNPNADSGVVTTIGVSGSTVYVGGNFQNIGGQARNAVAALDATTGQATAWNAGYPNGALVDALVATATTVYLEAALPLTDPRASANPFVAALDSSTAATNWRVYASGRIYALALSGGTLFVGGTFNVLATTADLTNGIARGNLASLDAATGAISSWNPAPLYAVYDLAASGGTLYVGGRFPTIAGAARNNLAAFSLASLQLTAWNPGTGDEVRALAATTDAVYAGGIFTSAGGVTRNFLAALDLSTGRATSFNPNLNGSVTAMVLTGQTMFVAGGFNRFGGAPRQYLAEFTLASGQPTGFAPPGPDIPPYNALAVSDTTVYAGGFFTRFFTNPTTFRSNLVGFDRTTGAITGWNPSASQAVYALALSGSTIYVGGDFLNVGGQQRHRIAALDLQSGRATSWNPGAESGSVNTIAVSGTRVYAGGSFGEIGGKPRNRIAAIDAGSGRVLGWNPDANDAVRSLAVSGGTVYVGGQFSRLGGVQRFSVGAVSAKNGAVTAWDPHAVDEINTGVTADGAVRTIAVSPTDGEVYLGGGFIDILNGSGHSFIAGVSPSP
jgi:trimeric autotransporter adhesin